MKTTKGMSEEAYKAHQTRIHRPAERAELVGKLTAAFGSSDVMTFPLAPFLKKPGKYSNTKVVAPEGTFDSKKEYARWTSLRCLQDMGAIENLERQVVYELAPSVVIRGRKRPPLRFIADFRYVENGKTVVEDSKGFQTPVYKAKRHLMKSVHGIEVKET